MDWRSDRGVDAIPAIDEGITGAQTSGVLQMLMDPGCDRCSHGDCIQSLASTPWRCFCSLLPVLYLHPVRVVRAVLSTMCLRHIPHIPTLTRRNILGLHTTNP